MDRQVFKSSTPMGRILFLFFIIVIVGILYYSTKNPWSFVLLLFFIPSFISSLKNKLVIENGNLRLEKIIRPKEVSLVDVTQIIVEQRETTDSDGDRSTITYMNVLDKAGHSMFTFSFAYIAGKKDKERFKEAIHAVNPAIEMDFDTNFEKMKAAIKEYRENKKEEKAE